MTAARMTRTADGLSYRVTFPFDRIVVDAIKADVPAHSRTYDPDEKAWYIAVAYQRIIRQLLEAVFIEVEMDSERTTYTPPSDRAPRTEYTVLHLLPSAPPELVESAYDLPSVPITRSGWSGGEISPPVDSSPITRYDSERSTIAAHAPRCPAARPNPRHPVRHPDRRCDRSQTR